MTENTDINTVDNVNKESFDYDNVNLKLLLKPFGSINKVCDLLSYVFTNADREDNKFVRTYKEISEDLLVNNNLISRVFKGLKQEDILRRVKNGVWMINPKVVFHGDEAKKEILINEFEGYPKYESEDEPEQRIVREDEIFHNGYSPWLLSGVKGMESWFSLRNSFDRIKRYIISNIRIYDNCVIIPSTYMAIELNVTYNAIEQIVQSLEEDNIIKHVYAEKWMVNPTCFYAGDRNDIAYTQAKYDNLR